MGAIKPLGLDHADILRLEAELNNLWGELNTAGISNHLRTQLESKLSGAEEQFKAVMNGHAPIEEFQKEMDTINHTLSIGMIEHAQQGISKSDHGGSFFQALENVKKELNVKKISPLQARHEVKTIIRSR